MIYLKRFNESNDSELLDTIISNCKDILIDLSDHGFECYIKEDNGEVIINMGSYNNDMIKLSGYELMFNHLFNYLESNGFKLCDKLSYFQNSTWDYHEACPECDSQLITVDRDGKDFDGWIFSCDKCKFSGNNDDFLSSQHPLTKDELFWAISKNYHIEWMLLGFFKV